MLQFTTLVGLDREHVQELQWTWPTWMRHRPEIMQQPLLLVCDGDVSEDEWERELSFLQHPDLRRIQWNLPGTGQREKMLTGLTIAPAFHVRTPWYLKLDTDVVAARSGRWIHRKWFRPDQHGRLPAFISSPWGYTKPADAIDRLDAWAARIPQLACLAPLNIHPEPGASLVAHPRITSWCFFGNTDWTREVVRCFAGRLPVPSHDTTLWYCAARRGDFYRIERMKVHGWLHLKRRRALHDACLRALGQQRPIASNNASDANSRAAPQRQKSRATPSHGVLYLLTGPGHAARLVVSLRSLRTVYDGPVTLRTTEAESHVIGNLIAGDRRFNVVHEREAPLDRGRNATLWRKVETLSRLPYDVTAFLDADTLVMGDISPLFQMPGECQLVATQFADWSSSGGVVRKRIERWRSVSLPEYSRGDWRALIDDALRPRPAINVGVFAVRRGAPLVESWRALARAGRRTFICDEIALQLLLHRFPHRVLDCRWNCSPVHAAWQDDVRIWHFHGDKHLRGAAAAIWLPQYELCIQENLADLQSWTPSADPALADHLRTFQG